ncbi:helix-turn-helix domain-containing protein [Butyrivibrio fibrisolvens]|uniref:helix-turn-helix domain-containing protein n=1 Tax=Butyrivibrio fibrisolvens TaxID=831 RepID=UPI0004153FC8|nr:helix-turn-helix transcriptional regulator [Butyrivibrio fibrisolvens]
MEANSYPVVFGENVRNMRKKKGMSQVDFYRLLYPGDELSVESIKKKMNKIENGKFKNVDFDLLQRYCSIFDVSVDFLFGREKDYSNYDNKFISEYTGLSDKVIKQLHKWNKDKNIKLSEDLQDEMSLVCDDISDKTRFQQIRKETAMIFLGMINLLFEEGTETVNINGHKHKNKFSNLSIIHSLYMLCVDQPKVIYGHLTKDYMEDNYGYDTRHSDYASMKASNLLYQDEDGVYYPLNMAMVIQQQARKRLDKAIDLLRIQIKDKREKNKNSSKNGHLNIFE